MQRFADLANRLLLTPQRNGKLRLLEDYFRSTPDPDRGFALAALTGDLDIPGIKPAMIRSLVAERVDPELFAYSYDYVGDLAETVALIWPETPAIGAADISLGETVHLLASASRSDGPAVLARLLDRLSADERYATLKLVTGGMRVGLSGGLARQALARLGSVDPSGIDEIWHGLAAPYASLFAWLEGRAAKPAPTGKAGFRPVMLAQPLQPGDLDAIHPDAYAAEWKWDGIRVQFASAGGTVRLYSRSGDDITGSFPELHHDPGFPVVIDGELLAGVAGARTGAFSDLQQRLNRKKPGAKIVATHPVFIRAYDLLFLDGADLRGEAFSARRQALEQALPRLDPARFDLSPLTPFADAADLDRMRQSPPHPAIEGVMLKRHDAPYVAGRPKGPWFKWKRDPHSVDAVLMYAQRGHGKRSGFYSDYTFGVWQKVGAERRLTPVGKAYFGFTDEELRQIDKFVRDNTVERFGPVRSVRAEPGHGLVLEIAFEGLNRSSRHKSGVAMRFPRIARIRWDKRPEDADTLAALETLLD